MSLLLETARAEIMEKREETSAAWTAARFVRGNWLRMIAVSAVLLIPCYWHRRIEAGDLASHVYNAWLAQLIEKGQAPGLYLARRSNNVVFDIALLKLGKWFGLALTEKIAVSACVLIFFWGAFALLSAVTRRAPWFLLPCLGMLAYGWTFNVGFFNYYLSLGLGFFVTAIAWRAVVRNCGDAPARESARLSRVDMVIVVLLAGVTLLAHAQGFVWLVGCVGYVVLWTQLRGHFKLLLPAAAGVVILAVGWYLPRHYESYTVRDVYGIGLYNGVDQLALYSTKFHVLAGAALVFGILCFVMDALRRRRSGESWTPLRLPFELHLVAVCATYFLPDSIRLPLYAGWIGSQALRLTTVSAVMGLCVLGFMRPKKWHIVGFAVAAVLFFAFLYQATGVLNRMEAQIERLVTGLPAGERITANIWAPPDSRLGNILHIADRACIGKCFSYQNYEAATGEFRVRAREDSPIVAADPDATQQMEAGEYVVRPQDLPMAHIYQCDEKDLTRLCIRQLAAGELNGRIGYHPPKE